MASEGVTHDEGVLAQEEGGRTSGSQMSVVKFVRHTCAQPRRCVPQPCHLCQAPVCEALWTTQWCTCDACWQQHLAVTQPPAADPG